MKCPGNINPFVSSPSLQAAGGCRRKGGPGSWRCVRGPAQCRAAGGRNEPTGSTDRLQEEREIKEYL